MFSSFSPSFTRLNVVLTPTLEAVLNHLSLLLFDLSLRLFDLSFRLFDLTVRESKPQSGVFTLTVRESKPQSSRTTVSSPAPPSSRLHHRLFAGSIVCSSHGLVPPIYINMGIPLVSSTLFHSSSNGVFTSMEFIRTELSASKLYSLGLKHVWEINNSSKLDLECYDSKTFNAGN
ncbi:uncharacterized protein DS421_10g299020 [Arachis hypogaea]|nr:uncharacterized protein DS421_10g299020 [Arachis hypogaea]